MTFLGALVAMVPETDTSKRDAVFSVGKKIAIVGAKAVMREGYKDLVGALAPDKDGKANTLQDIAKSVGQDLSKAVEDLIASQLSAKKYVLSWVISCETSAHRSPRAGTPIGS